jgi:uncharacterized protein (DUF1778 family)
MARKGERVFIRLSPPEKDAFREAAEIAGLGLSAWIRERLRRAALRELEEVGRTAAFVPLPRR